MPRPNTFPVSELTLAYGLHWDPDDDLCGSALRPGARW
jgi:hypothetical protein